MKDNTYVHGGFVSGEGDQMIIASKLCVAVGHNNNNNNNSTAEG